MARLVEAHKCAAGSATVAAPRKPHRVMGTYYSAYRMATAQVSRRGTATII